jgi:monomeric sarcosine oxidase
VAHWHTIVIGGGTMGSAAAWELAKRGHRALVLEQFGHVHTLGAHGGQTRIIRHAYAEGVDYVPFVLRADELWTELERESGSTLLHRVGALELDTKRGDRHAQKARVSAAQAGIPFEWLSADQIRERFPQFAIGDDWEGGFGARSGFLEVEPALRALAALARDRGVVVRDNEPVTAWGSSSNGVWIETNRGRETADHAIVAAGAWSTRLMDELGLPIRVLRKTLWWLEMREPDRFAPGRMPCFIADRPGLEFYGFPIYGKPGLKCADHSGGEAVTPDTVERTVRPGEETAILESAQWLFGENAVTGRVLDSAVCLYASTPDGHFIIDRHPDHANVAVAAGFSGHGFKFATAVGELVVELLDRPDARPPRLFELARLTSTA